MGSEPIALEISGEVTLDVYTEEMRQWHLMLEALAEEVSTSAPVRFVIVGLRAGSALAMVHAESDDEAALTELSRGYAAIGQALRSRSPIPFRSERIARAAQALIQPIGRNITAIRFETAEEDVTITSEHDAGGEPAIPLRSLKAYGSVTGRIRTLSSRNRLTFTLYDLVFDRAVTCYLRKGQEDLVRDKWDRRAMVDGLITRDPETGRPTTIRNIRDIVVQPEAGLGDFRRARGVIPFDPNAEPIGDMLRRLRDAW